VLHGGADLLYVDGNVVNGTTQTINLQIDGTPTALKGTPAPVVAVSGNVPAGSFVGGQVLNFDASNFLDLGVTLHTASAGGTNVVTAAVDVNGLNGTGVLGASLAQGMRSLVNSAVGTRSERMGLMAPSPDGTVAISPWLRVYSNNGNLSPEGSGLGAGQDFGFRQENRGREIGVDFAFGGNLSIGLLAGNADGDQRIDGGAGGAHFKQQGVGLYGTWIGRNLYVDVSHRTMDIDARLQGTTGDRQTSAQASASNIEAGFTGWSAGGFAITPQVQYTRSKIDHVDPLGGSQVRMAIEGGKSERGRIGVALSRSFDAGSGFTWTPYGSLSAVREFDGKSGFTIADTFSGSTSVEGSGTLAELGVGVRKGGLSATAGLNWANGGAVDDVRGGQVVVRYGW
jgi:outer membrane autotransporter protein